MMRLYGISGLVVASEIALPGAWPLDAGAPDVTMRRGPVPRALADPSASTPGWDATEDDFLLRGRDVGRFLVSCGREVVFEPEAGVPVDACAIYLQGTVIGVLLHQRGGVVLHASAVEAHGRAVLFCGRSGAGKSTLAAALSARGHDMLSDDVCRITFDDAGRPIVSGDARLLKLTDSALAALDLERGEAAPGAPGKTYVDPLSARRGAGLPLGAVYLLRQGADVIERLDTVTALRALKRNAHRPGQVRRTGLERRYFAASAGIVRHAGVFTLRRRQGLPGLSRTAAMLEDHWRTGA